MPVCSRCTGIYTGFIISLLAILIIERCFKAVLPPKKIIIISIILFCLMLSDVFLSSFLKVLPENNIIRFVTGYWNGWFLALILLPLKNSIVFKSSLIISESYLNRKKNFIIWVLAGIFFAGTFIFINKQFLIFYSVVSIIGLLFFISILFYILLFAASAKLGNSVSSAGRYIIFFIPVLFFSAALISLSSLLKELIYPFILLALY